MTVSTRAELPAEKRLAGFDRKHMKKLLRLIPFVGKRIDRNPKAWLYGTAAIVALVLLSKWLNIPFSW